MKHKRSRRTFKEWLRDWFFRIDEEVEVEQDDYAIVSSSHEEGFITDESIRFDVTSARGGLIVSVRHFDPKTDRSHCTVHVIPDDRNVAESIAEIVSLEMLKH